MILRSNDLMLLFIIHTRIPRGKLVEDIIRNKYGETYVKKKYKVLKSAVSNWGNVT